MTEADLESIGTRGSQLLTIDELVESLNSAEIEKALIWTLRRDRNRFIRRH